MGSAPRQQGLASELGAAVVGAVVRSVLALPVEVAQERFPPRYEVGRAQHQIVFVQGGSDRAVSQVQSDKDWIHAQTHPATDATL